MPDEDLEATLRRYRPRDPGAALRRRMLDAAGADAGSTDVPWFWGPLAAAAILLLWFAAHASRIEPERDPMREAERALIAEVLGGGPSAMQYAERIVRESVPDTPVAFDSERPW